MNFAVLFGGNSYEHEISIVSAIVLKKVFRGEMSFIFCDRDRNFYLISQDKMNAKTFSSLSYKREKMLFLRQGGFFEKGFFKEKKLEIDACINLIHGRDGEDGKIASLMEFFGLRYIGPRLEASVLSYNKELTKLYAKKVGVKTLPYYVLRKKDKEYKEPKYPCILKALRLGSSIGLAVAKNKEEFEYARDLAFEFDDEILVEDFIQGVKEYNLAACKIKDEMIFSIIEEPKKNELLDFEQKYLSFSSSTGAKEAKISDELKNKLKEACVRIYDPVFKGALIRCDFFVIDNEVYLNEINPNPGSLANYLFDDFSIILQRLGNSVKNEKHIDINYSFLHSINGQKSKL